MADETRGEVREGGCYCGAVRFEVTLPTRFCAHCHCDNCRGAHGAAFVTWAGYPDAQFRLTAGEDVLRRYETETGATRSFCGRCGTTLLYQSPRWAGEVHVARNNIEGDIDRLPGAHVYVDHGASWFEITDDLPRYGGKTGTEKKS
jgi:hypothetical protein